jgi:hypothetical protein
MPATEAAPQELTAENVIIHARERFRKNLQGKPVSLTIGAHGNLMYNVRDTAEALAAKERGRELTEGKALGTRPPSLIMAETPGGVKAPQSAAVGPYRRL